MLPERRYAEWLPTSKPPPKPRLANVGCACGAAALVGFMLTPLLSFEALGRVFLPLFLLLSLSYALTLTGFILHWRKQKARVPLRELPALVDQFPATMTLSRETSYGIDEGLVSFVDGWLLFSGQGISVSVRPSDVRFVAVGRRLSFEFDGPHGTHRATFVPMGKGLQGAWAVWKSRAERPAGEPTFPPVVPQPGRWTNPFPRGFALFNLVLGLLSLRAAPLIGAVELLSVPIVLLFDAAAREGVRRLARGLPPRADGLVARLRGIRGRAFGLRPSGDERPGPPTPPAVE